MAVTRHDKPRKFSSVAVGDIPKPARHRAASRHLTAGGNGTESLEVYLNRSPAFQFYPDKWQSHTRRLSDSSYRVFHELLCWMWQHADDHCSIQSSPEAVACAVAMPLECVRIALAEIQNPFSPLLKDEGEKWISNGLRKEAEKQGLRRAKAKESADARWREANAMRTHVDYDASAQAKQCFPSPSPSPSPSQKKEKRVTTSAELKEIFDAWNALDGLPKCLVISDKRRRALEVRLNDTFFSTNWKAALKKIEESPFCRGENDRGWKASFDWFIQPDVCVKALEGKYDSLTLLPGIQGGGQATWKLIKDLEAELKHLDDLLQAHMDRVRLPEKVVRREAVRAELAKLKGANGARP